MVDWSNRPIKKYIRTLVASVCTKGKKHALFFPADHARDALSLKDAGVFNGLTTLLAIEKDPKNMTKARRALSKNGFGNCKGRPTWSFTDLLHKLDLADHVDNDAGGKKLDFAWFDYCGFFMNHEADWTAKYANYFMHENADVLFTFQAVIRGRAKPYAYFQKIEDATSETEIAREIVAVGPVTTMHVRNDGSIYNVLASPAMLRALALRRIGLRKLFPGFTFDMTHTTYKDRDPKTQDDRGPGMILIHLTNIRAKYALAC